MDRCPDCGGELCDHGKCEADCYFDRECDCFEWAEVLSFSDLVRRQLNDQEPTHATK